MANFTEDDLKRQIKARDFSRIYIIHGNENFLKQHYINLIIDKALEKDFKDFNFHNLDGKDLELNELADCVSTFPMMGEYTCTLVKDFPFTQYWHKQQNNRYKFDQDLETVLQDLPETSILIFWCDTVEVDEKDTRWKNTLSLIDKLGVNAKIDKRSPASLSKLLVDSAEKKGCEISKADAIYMISVVGTDYSTLRNEFDKVCAYRGSGKITRDDIDETAISSNEAKIYSLSKDISNGEADKAYATLSNLFKLREDPVFISATLAKAYIDMYRVSAIKEKGIRPSELINIFPSYQNKSFAITNAERDGGRYTLSQLHTALDALSDADRRLKSTGQDEKLILEELILKLLRI